MVRSPQVGQNLWKSRLCQCLEWRSQSWCHTLLYSSNRCQELSNRFWGLQSQLLIQTNGAPYPGPRDAPTNHIYEKWMKLDSQNQRTVSKNTQQESTIFEGSLASCSLIKIRHGRLHTHPQNSTRQWFFTINTSGPSCDTNLSRCSLDYDGACQIPSTGKPITQPEGTYFSSLVISIIDTIR